MKRSLTCLGVTAVAAMVASVLAGPAEAAEGSIQNAAGPTAVADSYIVVLEDAEARRQGVAALARQLTERHDGSIEHVYQAALRGFATAMTEANARRLAAHPAVAYVEQNHTVRLAATQTNPPSWGLDRIDQRNLPLDNAYTYPTTASNVHAYVIDTGVRNSHQSFGGRSVSGIDTVDNDNDSSDCNGHGTHVAGTVGGSDFGVAKAVRIVGVRVLNCQGSGSNAGVIAGVDWVTANAIKPAVANMSLGGSPSSALDTSVRNSIASGISYALAAGNSNTNACNSSPARVAEGITVGATTINDARASFSNIGTCLDLFAPGQDITSAWWTSDTATNRISGTATAAPHAAGAAALYLASNPGASPQQVRDHLVNNATTGKVTNPGSGSPNRLLYVTQGGGGGGGCTAAQLLGNPGFESSSAAPWTATAGVIDSSSGQPPRSGSKKAWLNGYGRTHTDTLSQTVSIPAGCTTATFSFWLRITTAETTTTIAYDKLTVAAGSTTLATYSNLNKNSTYTQKSFSLSGFAGQTVTLKFTGAEDSSLATSFVIDDTALNVS
ncbi:hypothetical protein BH20ACT5_BH20ACT5_03250 [soil metagenome]